MLNKLKLTSLLTFMLISLSAFAYDDVFTVGKLAEIQSNTILFKAQLEQKKILDELNKSSSIASINIDSKNFNFSLASTPFIKSIFGRANNLTAIITYPTGEKLEVNKGDKLLSDFIVSEILSDKVIIKKGELEKILNWKQQVLETTPFNSRNPNPVERF